MLPLHFQISIHEQFGKVEGSPLFNVAATPGPVTSPSAAVALASINVVINSGAWTKPAKVPSKENGVIPSQHNVPSELGGDFYGYGFNKRFLRWIS